MASKLFTKEADLCTAFIVDLGKIGGWIAYPETAGWDILLIRSEDGFQIGVQAKLTLNPKVLVQALIGTLSTSYADMPGPDCRAVLVPDDACSAEISQICSHLGVTVIRFRKDCGHSSGRVYYPSFSPDLPRIAKRAYGQPGDGRHPHIRDWYEWAPAKRELLPEYIPDVAAGNSSPVVLTDWKVRAIRLSILLDERAITRADLAHLGLSASRWISPDGWLAKATGGGWERGKRMPDFKAQHPVVYEQIKADREKWSPKLGLLEKTA